MTARAARHWIRDALALLAVLAMLTLLVGGATALAKGASTGTPGVGLTADRPALSPPVGPPADRPPLSPPVGPPADRPPVQPPVGPPGQRPGPKAHAGLRVGDAQLVSVGLDGGQFTEAETLEGWGISDNGSKVVFTTNSGVFVRDTSTESTILASVLPNGDPLGSVVVVDVSADGERLILARYVNPVWELYLRDISSGTTQMLTPDVPMTTDDPLPYDRLSWPWYFASTWAYHFEVFGDLEIIEVRRDVIAFPGGVPGSARSTTGIGEAYRFAVSTGERTFSDEYSWYRGSPPQYDLFAGSPYLGTRSDDGRLALYFSSEPETPDDTDPPWTYEGPPRGDYFLHDFVAGTTELVTGPISVPMWWSSPSHPSWGPEPLISSEATAAVIQDVDGIPHLWRTGILAPLDVLPPSSNILSADWGLELLAGVSDGSGFVFEPERGAPIRVAPGTVEDIWVAGNGSAVLIRSPDALVDGDVNGADDLYLIPLERPGSKRDR